MNDDVNFKFGFLLQGQGDWTQNPRTTATSQNLFLRRARVLVGGQVAKNVTFFFETDSPNLGKVVGGSKVTSGLIVQDAFVCWKLSDEFTLDGGLILTGIAHNSLQSAASLISIDYGPHSFLYSGPEQNVVGRDTGFQVRGYPAKKKLEYRVGVWQGNRDAASRNALRGDGAPPVQLPRRRHRLLLHRDEPREEEDLRHRRRMRRPEGLQVVRGRRLLRPPARPGRHQRRSSTGSATTAATSSRPSRSRT